MIKESFESILNNVSIGNFGVSGEAPELPFLNELNIKNIGPVKFPLNEESFNKIIKVCKEAPFGYKDLTVYDKKIRDSYQLEPSQIEIPIQNWNENVEKLVLRIGKEMNLLYNSVTAKPYKMLVYQKGGHFSMHRDSEKEKNMFATLIIQLPSVYTGGLFKVYNKDEEISCDFGKISEHSMLFTAHYADMFHELEPLTSGYRAVLIYSLCTDDMSSINTKCANLESDKLAKLMDEMLLSTKKCFAITLDHEYTSESIIRNGLFALKGNDAIRYHMLKLASHSKEDKREVNFYLVKVTLDTEASSYDDGPYFNDCEKLHNIYKKIEEFDNVNYYFTLNWYDANGKLFYKCKDFKIFEKIYNLNIPDTVSNDDHDDKYDGSDIREWFLEANKTGYTGNEGFSINASFNKYILAFGYE